MNMKPHPPRVYTNFFELMRVDGLDLIRDSYRIRYQVYCVEKGFLDPEDYPDRIETDEYDAQAIHLLARHRDNGIAAGTARLILDSALGFPLETHCPLFPGTPAFRVTGSRSPTIGPRYVELSRLAVSKLFRQRDGDDPMYGGPPRSGAERQIPRPRRSSPPQRGSEIVAGLFKCIYQESKRHDLTHWLVAMERGLYLMVRRLGFHFDPIGPEVDYYGPVRPYVAEIAAIERSLFVHHPDIYAYWMEGLEPSLQPRIAHTRAIA